MVDAPCGKNEKVNLAENAGAGLDQTVPYAAGILEGGVILELEIRPLKQERFDKRIEGFPSGVEVHLVPVLT